jgi:glycosyltransferase involved in cell wall biosynthesis
MAAILHQRLPGAHFIWIGSGPLESDAHQLSADLGLNDVLHFVGQRQDVPELLQTLDCFVLSSLWEGFPLVLLEAMAAGVPVVATDIPGNDEAVRSGMDGLLVHPGNVMALAESVQSILNIPLQADEFRRSARQRLEQEFSPAAMLEGLTAIYKQVVFMRRAVPFGRVSRKESL